MGVKPAGEGGRREQAIALPSWRGSSWTGRLGLASFQNNLSLTAGVGHGPLAGSEDKDILCGDTQPHPEGALGIWWRREGHQGRQRHEDKEPVQISKET